MCHSLIGPPRTCIRPVELARWCCLSPLSGWRWPHPAFPSLQTIFFSPIIEYGNTALCSTGSHGEACFSSVGVSSTGKTRLGQLNKALLLMRSPGSQVNQSSPDSVLLRFFIFRCAGKAWRRVSNRAPCSAMSIIRLVDLADHQPPLLLIIVSITKPVWVIY